MSRIHFDPPAAIVPLYDGHRHYCDTRTTDNGSKQLAPNERHFLRLKIVSYRRFFLETNDPRGILFLG